ncbi:sulfurtransferase [Frigoribacterium salinisoli]
MQTPFVSLEQMLAEPVTVVDLGSGAVGQSPHEAFAAGHVPGAVHVDLDRWLAAPPSATAGRHPLPDPETFAEGMRRAGVGATDQVVAYDRAGGVFAARLVWMLRAVGVDAAVLDGGLGAWTASHGEDSLETGETGRPTSGFPARDIPPALLADLDVVAGFADAALRGEPSGAVLLDAREGTRFRGEPHPLDAVSGHIPGARSLPCRDNLDDRGFLLPEGTLRARLSAAGIEEDTPVISSCGSGVTACHTLLLLEHLGLGRGRLYPGSWSQWSGTDLPVS